MEQHTPLEHMPVPVAQSASQKYLIPGAIVIAGGFIAVALFFSGGSTQNTLTAQVPPIPTPAAPPSGGGSTNNVREVTSEDHIKGNPNAKVLVVEYSDYECPFCKRFHDTMNDIMKDVGSDGDVAWIFRQFPLDKLHPKNARKVALAAECSADQGGNDAFWAFTDRFMELTLSNDRTDLSMVLPQIYGEIGMNQNKLEKCITSGKYDQHIQDDVDNAIATGGRGTPWSVIIGPNGKTYPLNGAQPKSAIEQLIKLALQG